MFNYYYYYYYHYQCYYCYLYNIIEKTENEILLFNIILDNILFLLYKQKNYLENITTANSDSNTVDENIINGNNEINENIASNNNSSENVKKSDSQKVETVKDIIFDDSKTDAPLSTVQEDCMGSLNYMWNLFQVHYLDKFFPGIAMNEVDLTQCICFFFFFFFFFFVHNNKSILLKMKKKYDNL